MNNHPNSPPTAKPIAVSVKTAALMLEVSEKTIRRLIERGELESIRVGRAVRISVQKLREMISGKPIC